MTISGLKNTLKTYGLSKGIPSLVTCADKLTKKQQEQIAKMINPTFLLIPPVPTMDLIKALDEHKQMPNQLDCYLSTWFKGLSSKGHKIKKWEWAIVEGTQELEADTKLTGRKLKDQLEDFTKDNDLITIRQYIVLTMMALVEKKPLDVKYWSALVGGDGVRLLGGFWFFVLVFFVGNFLEDENHDARWRSAVMGLNS